MRRKQRRMTRRRRALYCAAAAAALLILVQGLLRTALLLSIQAVRLREEQNGVLGTRVLRRLWEPDIYGTSLLYLTANDRAVLFTGTSLTLQGWQSAPPALLDCTEDRSLHAAAGRVSRKGEPEARLFFFGRVDDPAVETVELSLRTAAAPGQAGEEVLRLTVPEEDWIEQGGRRYFLLPCERPTEPGARTFVTGLDSAGETVAEFQID